MKFVCYLPEYGYYPFFYGNTHTEHEVYHIYGENIARRNLILRFFHKVHTSSYINNIFTVPGKRIWNTIKVPKCIKKNDEVCFIFNCTRTATIEEEFYTFIRDHYKKSKLVLQLWNPVDWGQGYSYIKKIMGYMDMVCTYNPVDVEKYHITPYPYILFQLQNIKVKPLKDRKYDVLFVGQDKGRVALIENLYKKLTSFGLNCKFYVVGVSSSTIPGIIACDWMPYSKLINLVEDSRCIVNILQSGADGVTVRDIEAYNYGCYIITNSICPDLNDIFSNDQLINIDMIDENIAAMIKKRESEFPRRVNKNTLDNFYYWLERQLAD